MYFNVKLLNRMRTRPGVSCLLGINNFSKYVLSSMLRYPESMKSGVRSLGEHGVIFILTGVQDNCLHNINNPNLEKA